MNCGTPVSSSSRGVANIAFLEQRNALYAGKEIGKWHIDLPTNMEVVFTCYHMFIFIVSTHCRVASERSKSLADALAIGSS